MYNWQKIKQHPELQKVFKQRAQIIQAIRDYFNAQDFTEVKTPVLVTLPGMEPNLVPFKSTVISHTGYSEDGYLITSPEYAMKKLLCAGFERIYEITSAFRNAEDASPMHNTEFTMLEWYRSPGTYIDLMADVEGMMQAACRAVFGKEEFEYQGKTITVAGTWERKTVATLFAEYLDLDLEVLRTNKEVFVAQARLKNYEVDAEDTWQDIFYKLFLTHIEPYLGWQKPVIVYDYPVEMAALSKVKADDPRYAERMEFYIAGLELGNGFSELTDADEQLARLQVERQERRELGREDYAIDMSFINALREGMPEATGIAVGIDRIVMLLLGKSSVKDVILFPQEEMFFTE